MLYFIDLIDVQNLDAFALLIELKVFLHIPDGKFLYFGYQVYHKLFG